MVRSVRAPGRAATWQGASLPNPHGCRRTSALFAEPNYPSAPTRYPAPMSAPIALGFSDHAGWAVMAAVRKLGPGEFELVVRRRIQTCPPELPRQPYHAVAEAGMPRDTIGEVEQATRRLCRTAFSAALEETPAITAAAVAMGRTSVPTDRDRILASHALLHTAEGELYRDALSEAAGEAGLRVVRFMNKESRSEAAAALGWTPGGLERWLASTGKAAGKPWTKDEKDASAAALLALATTTGK